MTAVSTGRPFLGWRVVWGAFVLAVLGWGLGFYGPSIYLHAIREARGWPVGLISLAVTCHFLCGALVIANLPKLHARFGVAGVTRVGVVALAAGLVGWALAREPWQLFLATVLTGGGWVTMGAAAINAIISPWFVRQRPRALSLAYNGASVGGVVFSPLWVWLIDSVGFSMATAIVGIVTIGIVLVLTATLFNKQPSDLGQMPDGEAAVGVSTARVATADRPPLPGGSLWRNTRFQTLAAAMALSLFAQIGLLAHLFSLIVPALGTKAASILMGAATASAIVGRTAFGWWSPANTDRRLLAAVSYAIQIAGVIVLVLSGDSNAALIVLGVLLFGFGIGNATSLPPLIAQVEFAPQDTGRVVALIVAIAQAIYAFAPAVFGWLRGEAIAAHAPSSQEGSMVFIAAITAMTAALVAMLAGRR